MHESTANALKDYPSHVGQDVATREVQSVFGLMTAANLLMRVRHGHYGVTDSFVEQAWRARLESANLLRNTPAPDEKPAA